MLIKPNNENGVAPAQIVAGLKGAIAGFEAAGREIHKALMLVPDITRANSGAGFIAKTLYDLLPDADIDILPALGTHLPMTEAEIAEMYPGLPAEKFLVHNWRTETVPIGVVPASFVREITGGLVEMEVPFSVNKRVLDKSYDIVISIGQVVPHEVVGMANYNKNIFVGCGGTSTIHASHFIGAVYGMERMMGRDHTPLHRLFDYAQEHFLSDVPLLFALTVMSTDPKRKGIYECLSVGSGREVFSQAIEVSREKNLIMLDKPLKKVVVYLDPLEFRRTWLGNKAIYRTRMAIADGGELIVIGPGISACGEDIEIDVLIKKYGYVGRDRVLECVSQEEDLRASLSAAAHLIHGSSDGRFTITYATDLMRKEEIESIHFNYMPLADALAKYDINALKEGFNTVDGEEIFYISNPALGLWAYRGKFEGDC